MLFPTKLLVSAIVSSLLAVSAVRSQELKHPDWHPDGHQLIAEGSCAGSIDLYLIDLESRSVQLVWDGGLTEGYPRWFPDGKRIAFHQIDENRNSRIFLAEFLRSGLVSAATLISDGPFDIEPSPSPDGTKIAYSQQAANGQDIAVLDLEDSGNKQVWKTDRSENFPSWHPSGASIIFHAKNSSGTHIYQRDLESDRLDTVTTSSGSDFVGHFSPQADRLVYSSERDGDREIYLYDFAAAKDRRLTDRPGRDGYPKFSPDGLSLAYHSVISEALTTIRVIDMNGSVITEFSCEDWVQAR